MIGYCVKQETPLDLSNLRLPLRPFDPKDDNCTPILNISKYLLVNTIRIPLESSTH